MKLVPALIGEQPRPYEIWIILVTGTFSALFISGYFWDASSWGQRAVLFVLTFDIMGGVAANCSPSTKVYWATQSKVWQIGFLVLHGAQPLVLWCCWELPVFPLLGLYAYSVIVGVGLLFIPKAQNQLLAVLLTLTGILLLVYITTNLLIEWFGVAYLMKLLLGFSQKGTVIEIG